VLRILLTNQGDYLWALSYGAGLPAQVGETTSARAIEAAVRRQMLTEPGVAHQPPPTVSVTPIFGGVIVARSRTATRATGQQSQVGITVER
jgi:hypothetical protein